MNIWQHFADGLFSAVPLNEPADELGDYDSRIRRILRRHVAALGWWGTINAAAVLSCFLVTNAWLYYFFIMGLVWGIINFSITVMLTRHAVVKRFHSGTLFERIETQHHVEKIMLFNVGPDVCYILFGLYLHASACAAPAERIAMYEGFGYNIIMQGLFLFVLDNRFHLMHIRNYKKAKPFFKKLLQ
jgi:hypothetical protein